MTDEQFERLALALERIAYALEIANLKGLAPTPAATGGYTCQKCFQWVAPGMFHSCNNFGGTTKPYPHSTITFNPSNCAYVTAAGMQCTLSPSHDGAHDVGIN